MTTIDKIKRSIATLNKIHANIQTDDYETLDALARTIRNLESDVFELELEGQPATDDLALVA